MQYSISGEIAQSVRLDFAPGESAWVSKGVLMAYSSLMQWSLRVPGGAGGALRRSLSGEGLALTFLETKAEDQYALLAANAPGHLEIWDLEHDGAVTTTRGSFVAAWGEDVDITVTVARRAGRSRFRRRRPLPADHFRCGQGARPWQRRLLRAPAGGERGTARQHRQSGRIFR